MTLASAVFIADVHLSGSSVPEADAFLAFLNSLPGRARRLCILGDLFDLWSGHADALIPQNRRVLNALDSLHRSGVVVTVVSGNRDLLLHDYLLKSRILDPHPDHCLLELDGRRLHVCHGDFLCLRDTRHLRLRRILSSRPFRALFLSLPSSFASTLACSLRRHSQRVVRSKRVDTLAIDGRALLKLFSSGVDIVICGHTHRPEHRVLTVGGRRCELFVLDSRIDHPGFLEYRDGSFIPQSLSAPVPSGPA